MTETDDTRPLDVRVEKEVFERCAHVWEDHHRSPGDSWSKWRVKCTKCGEDRAGSDPELHPMSGPRYRYSTDKAAAHRVLDRLNELGFDVEVGFWPDGTASVYVTSGEGALVADAHGPFAEAVCEAALGAVSG